MSEDILARYADLRARLDQPVTVTELVGEAFREVYDYAQQAEAALEAVPRGAIVEALSYQSLAHLYWHKVLSSWLTSLPMVQP